MARWPRAGRSSTRCGPASPASARATMLFCPPYVYISAIHGWLQGSPILLGAQDIADQAGTGAFTGEVSGQMFGTSAAVTSIVGHSERRALYGETDAARGAQVQGRADGGLTPILCVGETLEERDAGADALGLARSWLQCSTRPASQAFVKAVIAYEPVWAIGTGTHGQPRAGAGGACVHPGRDRGPGCYNCGRSAHPLRRQRQRPQRRELVRHGGHRRRARRRRVTGCGGISRDLPRRGLTGTVRRCCTVSCCVHVVVAVMIIGLVLLQRGKGAEAGTGFGAGASGTVFGARGSANFLSRATGVLATLFFITSLALAYLVDAAHGADELARRPRARGSSSAHAAADRRRRRRRQTAAAPDARPGRDQPPAQPDSRSATRRVTTRATRELS